MQEHISLDNGSMVCFYKLDITAVQVCIFEECLGPAKTEWPL